MIQLFPKVSSMKLLNGSLSINSALNCFFKTNEINIFKGFTNKNVFVCDKYENADIVYEQNIALSPQSYSLKISDKVYINYGDEAGAFYGTLTLDQMLILNELPCLEIFDKPDLEIRGLMYDISRNKVATLGTLKRIVDIMTRLKMNHFELYIEGFSFEYKTFEEYLEKDGFITLNEYIELQTYCNERFIDFVPNQNGFGHMTKWLEKDEFKDLKICPDGMHLWGRFRPASTLNPLNEQSIGLVKKMYKDMLPFTTSKYFNMNFDEPFELGRGLTEEKANEIGVGNVYIDYALKAYEEVKKYNKTPIIWGDVLLKHPDLLYRLPKDMIFCDWGYDANYEFAKHAAELKKQQVKFMTAPGATGWCTWTTRTTDWIENITCAIKAVKDYDGLGVLLTEWGDFGHFQSLPIVYAPLVYTGLYSWSMYEGTTLTIRDYLNRFVFKDKNNVIGDWFIDFGNYYRFEKEYSMNNTFTFKVFMWASWAVGDNQDKSDDEIIEYYTKRVYKNYIPTIKFNLMQKYFDFKLEELACIDIKADDCDIVKEECKLAIETLRNVQKLAVAFNEDIDLELRKQYLKEVLDNEHGFVEWQKKVWLARNKSGGLNDSLELLNNFYRFVKIVFKKLTKGEVL